MSLDILLGLLKINKAEEPGVPTPQDVILRPNVDYYPGMTPSAGTDNFAMIDEETADDDTTTLTNLVGGSLILAVGVPGPSVPVGATDISLTIGLRVKGQSQVWRASASFGGGAHTIDGEYTSQVDWTTHEDNFTTNPWDSNNPWTVANINTLDSINVFLNLMASPYDFPPLLTQLYLKVTYTPA